MYTQSAAYSFIAREDVLREICEGRCGLPEDVRVGVLEMLGDQVGSTRPRLPAEVISAAVDQLVARRLDEMEERHRRFDILNHDGTFKGLGVADFSLPQTLVEDW